MKIVLFLLITFIGPALLAAPAERTEAERIGTMVLEIQQALKKPEDAASLETIAEHGTDSRHYVMIRGWLVQLLAGAESQQAAAKDPALKAKHTLMVDFLKKAIRRIDLE